MCVYCDVLSKSMSCQKSKVKTPFDSTPSDMWVPETRIFTDKEAAYAYYRSVCPAYSEDDDDSHPMSELYKIAGYHGGEYKICGLNILLSSVNV